jgi:hypothetical protein
MARILYAPRERVRIKNVGSCAIVDGPGIPLQTEAEAAWGV